LVTWYTFAEKLDAKVSKMERRIESMLNEKLYLIIKKRDVNSGRFSNSRGSKGFKGILNSLVTSEDNQDQKIGQRTPKREINQIPKTALFEI
jgi:hypothetical protein